MVFRYNPNIPGRLTVLMVFICSLVFGQEKPKSNTADKIIVNKKALRFVVLGDWGRNGEYNQKEVAVQMGVTAKEFNPAFFVSTGDNFYPNGVRSTQDHNWLASFENIYTAHSLQNDWYVVLGNHDYGGNPDAEVEFSRIDERWNMPARYFSKIFYLNGDSSQGVLLVFLDTTPLISQSYKNIEHVRGQDTTAQRIWLESVLANAPAGIKWKLVFGHHPLYTGGGRMYGADTKELHDRLRPIFEKYHVNAYICGHDHSLQYIKPEGFTHYFISGAGSETTPAVLHPDGGKFAISENGFMTFSLTEKSLQMQAISYTGKILFSSDLISFPAF